MGLAVAGGEEEKRGRCVDMIDFDAARRDDAVELKLFVFVRASAGWRRSGPVRSAQRWARTPALCSVFCGESSTSRYLS
jgi:hypothetical protein